MNINQEFVDKISVYCTNRLSSLLKLNVIGSITDNSTQLNKRNYDGTWNDLPNIEHMDIVCEITTREKKMNWEDFRKKVVEPQIQLLLEQSKRFLKNDDYQIIKLGKIKFALTGISISNTVSVRSIMSYDSKFSRTLLNLDMAFIENETYLKSIKKG